jgi:hypothetical protein
VSVSKSGLTVATCNRCHCQIFTRSDISDAALRGQIRPFAEVENVQEKAPAIMPAIEKTAAPEQEEKPAWLKW